MADADSDRLLGAQILALEHQMTTRDLGDTLFPYLTTVEALKLAAQGFSKDVALLSCCAG